MTRQMFRLGQLLHLPEALTFYYAHVGFYVTQGLVSASMPILVFAWTVVLAADCESNFRSFENYCRGAVSTYLKGQFWSLYSLGRAF